MRRWRSRRIPLVLCADPTDSTQRLKSRNDDANTDPHRPPDGLYLQSGNGVDGAHTIYFLHDPRALHV